MVTLNPEYAALVSAIPEPPPVPSPVVSAILAGIVAEIGASGESARDPRASRETARGITRAFRMAQIDEVYEWVTAVSEWMARHPQLATATRLTVQ